MIISSRNSAMSEKFKPYVSRNRNQLHYCSLEFNKLTNDSPSKSGSAQTNKQGKMESKETQMKKTIKRRNKFKELRLEPQNIMIAPFVQSFEGSAIFSLPKEQQYRHFSRVLKSRLCKSTEIQKIEEMRSPKIDTSLRGFSFSHKKNLTPKTKKKSELGISKKVEKFGNQLNHIPQSYCSNNAFSPKLVSKPRPSSGISLKKRQIQYFVKRPSSSVCYNSPYAGISFRKIQALTQDIKSRMQTPTHRQRSNANTYHFNEQKRKRSVHTTKVQNYEGGNSQILPWPNDDKITSAEEKKSLYTAFQITL